MIKVLLIVIAIVVGGVVDAVAATPVPSGRWSFVFTDAKGRPDRPIRVYTYRPPKCDSACPILIAMSGAKRNAYDYLGFWELAADRNRFIVIAPEFTNDRWPKAAAYQMGDIEGQSNREKWAYSAIEHIYDEVWDGQKGYMLYGHSAGAQFVQRMSILLPDNRATVMILGNPGVFMMPEWRKDKGAEAYPYSLIGSPAGEADLRKALARRIIVLAGDNDNEPDPDNLNANASVKKQGDTRIDRSENFIKAATAAAQDLGVKLGWELVEMPPTAQDAVAVARAAGEALYGKR
jgi:pimeloyl-ACP methyl ester carboxylesterase